jgi:hypothetical protein
MVDIAKLEKWVKENPEGATEPFLNVSTQRKLTLQGIYEELKKEEETGVAIVDEDLLQVVHEVEEWLKGV